MSNYNEDDQTGTAQDAGSTAQFDDLPTSPDPNTQPAMDEDESGSTILSSDPITGVQSDETSAEENLHEESE